MNNISYQDHSVASALTAASLSAVSLLAGSVATTDTLVVRAYNGGYWGDWTSLAITIGPSAPTAPVLVSQTATQTWLGGQAISLALPRSTFTDPQGQTLTYSATLSNGQALPSWLSFNAASETFSGTSPTTAQSLSIVVHATDTSGLSTADTFTATILGTPTLMAATANQSWVEGNAISLVLPANTFSDPQGQTLVYTAKQSNGQALPSWLSFNATTRTFSGTAPTTVQNVGITVTATDSSGLSATETFTGSVVAPAPTIKPGITVAATAKQTWTDGQVLNVTLSPSTFTDALGLKMTFAAFEVSGPNVTSWLHFNATTDTFSGTVATNASGTVQLEVIATDSQRMTATDLFSVQFAPAAGHATTALQLASTGSATPWASTPTQGVLAFHT